MSTGQLTPEDPIDADDILKRFLPEALSVLLSLRDEKNQPTDELTMRTWESVHFCFEAAEEQIACMCGELTSIPQRRGIISALQTLSKSLEEALASRLASVGNKPRLYRLSQELSLSEKEMRAFIYVLLCSDFGKISRPQKRNRRCRKFAAMSRTELFVFMSPERKHMKQGLISDIHALDDGATFGSGSGTVQVFSDSLQGKTVPVPVIKALYGGQLCFSEAMSVASSALASILAAEENSIFTIVSGNVMLDGIPIDSKTMEGPKFGRKANKLGENDLKGNIERMSTLIGSLAEETIGECDSLDEPEKEVSGSEDMQPYKTDLEYLSDGIAVIDAATEYYAKSGAKNEFARYGMRKNDRKAAKREAQLKLKKAESKFQFRLVKTMKVGLFFPRVERLVKKLDLSHFERLVIFTLIASVLYPRLSNTLKQSSYSAHVNVKSIIRVLCDGDLEKEIEARSSFYKSSKLVSSGVIFMQSERYGSGFSDLGDFSCSLDRMLFDYILGLETELSEIMDSARCYAPDVSMESVVLPEKMKQLVVERVENFEAFRVVRRRLGFDDIVRYGKGLSLFFHGKSGTGKTLFANALASHMDRKVLLIDVNTFGKSDNMPVASKLRIIFREAKVQNAIVFMDECDGLLESRGVGGNMVATILHEMENFDGIVILATNQPRNLDEAMHRRIGLSLEFPEPDAQRRLAIWKRHIPETMALGSDVSLEELAIEFELTGGFIKNAIFEALASSVTRSMKKRRSEGKGEGSKIVKAAEDMAEEDVELTMEDLRMACKRQSRADLARTRLQRRIIPVAGLDTLVAGEEAKSVLREVVEVERVRRVLATRWGFKGQQGRSNFVLIMGPPGSGKTHAAGCLGFETGRPLQTVAMSEILRKGHSADEIGKVFSEAAVAGAVVVIEQGERLMLEAAVPHNIASQGLELLFNIKSYSGLVVLCVASADSHSDAGWMPSEPIPNRIAILLSYIVKFEKPNRKQRLQLWKQLIPEDTPCAPDVEETLEKVASKYDTTGARILACINRAAAAAARRGNTSLSVEKMGSESLLTGKDLIESCEAEVALVQATNTTSAWVRALYA